jgi:hypothetical protein
LLRPALQARLDDQRDIKTQGLAATGMIRSVKWATNRGQTSWTYTVEFQVPGAECLTVFNFAVVGSWFRPPKPSFKQGESVAIHYREKWPSLAVIDALVK